MENDLQAGTVWKLDHKHAQSPYLLYIVASYPSRVISAMCGTWSANTITYLDEELEYIYKEYTWTRKPFTTWGLAVLQGEYSGE